ncbi:MAG: endo alpha-1,4 polygalactosaminidase [Rhizobiales bacterium]|nr:endo alpha-1,4 polygalactosaminidase [Hyphomicrobiales bacterium]
MIETSDGPVAFESWNYQLQGRGGSPLSVGAIAALDAGLVVIDHSRDGSGAGAFGVGEVAAMQGTGADRKVLLSYISIGESEDFRDYWGEGWTKDGTAGGKPTRSAPDWLGPLNPDWPDSRKVRYWDDDWQDIVIGRVEEMAAQGFDGAYLDIVDAYYFWAHEVKAKDRVPGDPKSGSEAAARMIDFIVELAAAARAINPDFVLVQQNAPFLLSDLVYDTGGKPKPDAARVAALHDAIAGIALEDLYLRGGKDEDNRFRPDKQAIAEIVKSYADAGEFVLSVDYARKPKLIEKYLEHAEDDGFIPLAVPDRGLDGGVSVGTAAGDVLSGGDAGDRLYGRSGDDQLSGGAGNDILMGNRGHDHLFGGVGKDGLFGGAGNDVLAGGPGRDKLAGGKGADIFVFAPGDGRDVILDWDRKDRLDLSAFDAERSDARIKRHDKGAMVVVGDVRILLRDAGRGDIDRDDDLIL